MNYAPYPSPVFGRDSPDDCCRLTLAGNRQKLMRRSSEDICEVKHDVDWNALPALLDVGY
jgi:hypothetical protein